MKTFNQLTRDEQLMYGNENNYALTNKFNYQTLLIEQFKQYMKENNMYTLQNIKDQYYIDLANGDTERRSLEEYIREEYLPCYDDELNFLGYDRV